MGTRIAANARHLDLGSCARLGPAESASFTTMGDSNLSWNRFQPTARVKITIEVSRVARKSKV